MYHKCGFGIGRRSNIKESDCSFKIKHLKRYLYTFMIIAIFRKSELLIHSADVSDIISNSHEDVLHNDSKDYSNLLSGLCDLPTYLRI